jgi:hypothetical protein
MLLVEHGMLVQGSFSNITSEIIGAAIEVHRNLGPGLLEFTEHVIPVHKSRLVTYLHLTNCRAGLLNKS